ncbi:hypothetical protein YH65_01015 [Sulfurovum lithotrophicum]|uniref:Alpha-1,2-fucosyltransferase n=1 Tax=Sulfurovum lithotrophicum TaxID=206403 RepID=A0A7U4RPZ1_9BACT|nr:alpha-1,2-fucosyltransferase [Sulfurovum lithotrophicum]AKF24141.1 hypothetical protein YH65_01015 [Sulfurovum lithotrophicum]
MIIINILGGLGNQMFQYAFAYSMAHKTDAVVKLDIEDFSNYDLREYELSLYNISLDLADIDEIDKLKYEQETLFKKVARKLQRTSRPLSSYYYKESGFSYDSHVYELKDNVYFQGYWQSEKYFLDYRDALLKEFLLKDGLHQESRAYEKKINQSVSVSLHIRRGDYVSNAHTNSVHGTCSLEYYKGAVRYLQSNSHPTHFFIFSDDLDWAKENLNFIENITFVSLDKDTPDHEEMYLMSQCKHNIIANSSFSWWGAWLNQNEDKIVVAPKKWFNDTTINTNDLVPKEWIRL